MWANQTKLNELNSFSFNKKQFINSCTDHAWNQWSLIGQQCRMFQYELTLERSSSVMMSIIGYGDGMLIGADINLHLYINGRRCGSNRFFDNVQSSLVPNASATCIVPLKEGQYTLTYMITSSSDSFSSSLLHLNGDLVVN